MELPSIAAKSDIEVEFINDQVVTHLIIDETLPSKYESAKNKSKNYTFILKNMYCFHKIKTKSFCRKSFNQKKKIC